MTYIPPPTKVYKYNIDTTAIRALGAVAAGNIVLGSFTDVVVRAIHIGQRALVASDTTSAVLSDFTVGVGYTPPNYVDYGNLATMHSNVGRSTQVIGDNFSISENPQVSLSLEARFVASGGMNLNEMTSALDNFLTIWAEIEELS